MKVRVHCSNGKLRYYQEKRGLKRAQVVVGTPGRLLDMIEKGWLDISDLKTLVIDEVDMILEKGFTEQFDKLEKYLPKGIQICLFSATMPPKCLEVCGQLCLNPVEILVDVEDLTLKGIKQYNITIEKEEWKLETLLGLFEALDFSKAMIFVNSKAAVIDIAKELENQGQKVSYICSSLQRWERNEQIKDFRDGKTNVMISTDVLARGIDFQQVQLVINYDIPRHIPTYIHRIGRTGRFGRTGVAMNFVTQEDERKMKFIMDLFATDIEECPEDLADILK